ncbi:uncharacterized protein LOC129774830 isoform X2 [Toxorhynchites rutilus septentrionalis]|uniref:uncharacterized protein LOC129774830 isoform X2 n=1 Tax=Toxorhynchites rutilus septentrionalis TaxID=329112 RepID=UPI00247905C9|nr:uncharacterized protein LOC129774830 isoform X2 [Toxorhynchites rutilus septentrionalis]
MGSFSTVFSPHQEEQLVMYAIEMGECIHGLSPSEIRSLAFQMAEKNGIQHPFNKEIRLAGVDWLKCFLRRNQALSLRKPENSSLARARGFNREIVAQFFDLLELIYNEHAYSPSRIWNADETGVSTVESRNKKLVARRGQRQVGRLVSTERGTNTRITMAMSASGQFLPPFFIFPRQRMNGALKTGAPPESAFTCNVSGWSTIDTFSLWFDHFMLFAHPTADNPVLLILDGHTSHTKNLDVLEKAKRNHVRIISIPPHTSHKTQPLDVTFMGPFKAYYSKALSTFMKLNTAGKLSIAHNDFRKTGIHPFNRQVFSDDDFAPSHILGRPFNDKKGNDTDPSNDASLAFGDCIIEANSVPTKWNIDDRTFDFIDEYGLFTSLVVQEYDDNGNIISAHSEETEEELAKSMNLPIFDHIDTNSVNLVTNEALHKNQQELLLADSLHNRREKRKTAKINCPITKRMLLHLYLLFKQNTVDGIMSS